MGGVHALRGEIALTMWSDGLHDSSAFSAVQPVRLSQHPQDDGRPATREIPIDYVQHSFGAMCSAS
jgi:hypothetical protein